MIHATLFYYFNLFGNNLLACRVMKEEYPNKARD